MNLKALKYLMIVLSIHILCVHWRIFYYLNPEVESKDPFSFLTLDEPNIISFVFAIAYSIITVLIVYATNRRNLIAVYAILDALAIEIFYNIDIHIKYASHYYSIYTFVIIISILILKSPSTLEERITMMMGQGINQKGIANKLGISESKVSRILTKLNGNSIRTRIAKENDTR